MVELEGTYTFNAPHHAVWEALMNPQVMVDILPGCEKLEVSGPGSYRAIMKIKVGPVQGQFEGTVTLSNIQPMDGYHIVVSGKGAPGFVNGEGDLRLEPQGDKTLMSYQGIASVGGRLAGVGQRLLDSSTKFIINQGLGALDQQIQNRTASGGGAGFG